MFTSDNGPAITGDHPHGSSGGLRDKKGTVYEGGIRVPGIAQWKGVASAGSVNDAPICGLDVLPTLCELAGVEVPEQLTLDGASVVRALYGGSVKRHEPLYWHQQFPVSFQRASIGSSCIVDHGRQIAIEPMKWTS